MTDAEARAAAEAEGLTLEPAQNRTGFLGVYASDSRFVAKLKEGGDFTHLGSFATALEAALHVARHRGAAASVTLRLPSGYTQATRRLNLGRTWATLRLHLGYS